MTQTATASRTTRRNNLFKNVTEHQNIQLGTIYACTWGYSMCIVDFYQVVRRSGNTVYTRRLNRQYLSGGGCAGEVTCIPDSFADNEEHRSRIKDEKYISIDGNKYGSVWDGQPKWYDHMD